MVHEMSARACDDSSLKASVGISGLNEISVF